MMPQKTSFSGQPRLLFVALMVLSSSAIFGADGYPNTVLTDSPTAYYRLEELPGETTALDSSATGSFPGTFMFDTAYTYPKLGQPGIATNSINLHPYVDGGGAAMTAYVSIPHAGELNPGGPFTVELWTRPTSVPGAGDYRCPVGNFGGWGDSSGWHLYQTPGPDSSWVWVMQSCGVWVNGGLVTKYKWDHLVAVFDGTNANFYVNGVLKGNSGAVTGYKPNSGTPLCIGSRDTAYGYFDGNVDEVALYSSALTLERIQAHYQSGTNSFRTGAMPPAITQDPAAATAYAGRMVTFTAGADGTAPLHYQWYRGNTLVPNANTDTLSFTCSLADDNQLFKAIVTNLYGSAESQPAKLTVLTNLNLVSSPQTITRNAGSKAAFRVVADGAWPLTYQWFKVVNSVASPITNATNNTLWLSSVQPVDDQSSFYALVSNPYTSTNSDPATLMVVPRPVVVPITGYARTVMADDPVAYWRLDESDGSPAAVDAAGSFDGSFDSGSAGVFTYGVATGIPHETDSGLGVVNRARVVVPYALELNPPGPFTAEAWLKPATLAADSSDYRTAFSSLGSGPTGWNLYQQPNNTWAWVLWGDNWASTYVVSPDPIVANVWYHMALVYDGSLFKVYVNGVLKASAAYAGFVPNKNGAANLGWRSDSDWKPFDGVIDDVAFYNKALNAQQVQLHYLNSVKLNATLSDGQVILSWPYGVLQQNDDAAGNYTDMTTATSPHTNTPALPQKFYRVKVQ
jgi:hypothetical protein